MPSASDWTVPPAAQPKPEDYDYDLDRALASVVGIRAVVPADAFTAETLGTERAGNGVLIREDGVVLTIGYLITEAETVWLTPQRRPRRARPCARLRPGDRLRPGASAGAARRAGAATRAISTAAVGDSVVVGGAGGRHACGGGAHRRPAGIRRLLGIRARRGDLHRARASQLGRHRDDRAAPAISSASARCSSSRPRREGQPSIST